MTTDNSPNILETEKIGALLWRYSIPAIVATTASSLYNVIDRIFIGHGVGPMAISGLALTLPIMNLSAAFGSLIGAGASSMVSIRLGEKDTGRASHILGNASMLNVIIGIVYSIIMLAFIDRILFLFGASKETLPYAKEFMHIILLGNVVTHLYMGLNNIMRSSGYPRKAMAATLLTVGLNLVLAPLFIFWFKWGIKGAAFATVAAQSAGLAWILFHFMNKNSTVHFLKGHFKLRLNIILDILSIGMSTFIMFVCTSLVAIIVNIKLVSYGGDYAVGAYGIIASMITMFMMIVLGFNQGMQPIAGYNYGARRFQRVKEVFTKTLVAGTCVTSFGFILIELFPGLVASAFTSDGQLIAVSSTGMRISFAVFFIVGFQMVTANFFQSIGHAKVSVILSLSRQVIFLIPMIYIISSFGGLYGIWAAMPASDLLASLVTFFLLRYQMKKLSEKFNRESV